jgi:hypothetical protein
MIRVPMTIAENRSVSCSVPEERKKKIKEKTIRMNHPVAVLNWSRWFHFSLPYDSQTTP